jgi:phage repressor protein C with HTH and peptisase S24 domain
MTNAAPTYSRDASPKGVKQITWSAGDQILRAERNGIELWPHAEPGLILILGDGGEPDYPNGSYVLVDTSFHRPSPPAYYVIFDGTTYHIRMCSIVIGSSNPVMTQVISGNPAYPMRTVPMASLHIVGMVLCELSLEPDEYASLYDTEVDAPALV